MRSIRLAALSAAIALAACVDQSQYLALAGGGFVFNYRNAEATYGIILMPRKDPPEGAVITVRFENPAGGPPIVVSRPARGGGRIELHTPALQGVEKDKPYQVVVILEDAAGTVLQRIEKSFASELDQSVLPERPLAIGPGYQPNIDSSDSPFPPALFGQPESDAGK